ncbi:hypothetical protein WJU16_00865 [Chitinophaga pollutisoli]|uniref:Uncharacterized protein n=1 Tax=Chitinophaga pollutisoli TaxID=3133966 RepID=A0ABZ2YQ71_9BACT
MEATNKLRALLISYTKTQTYEINEGSKVSVAAILLAISLYELGELQNRAISREEEQWFEGGYAVAREFDTSDWKDISIYYDRIVSAVKGKNFFRA